MDGRGRRGSWTGLVGLEPLSGVRASEVEARSLGGRSWSTGEGEGPLVVDLPEIDTCACAKRADDGRRARRGGGLVDGVNFQ